MSYLLFVTPRLGSSKKSFRVSDMARKVKKVLNIMELLDTGRCPITPTDINCRGCIYGYSVRCMSPMIMEEEVKVFR